MTGRMLLALALVAGAATPGVAHVAKLDPDRCHDVTEAYVNRAGVKLEAGTRHCHPPTTVVGGTVGTWGVMPDWSTELPPPAREPRDQPQEEK